MEKLASDPTEEDTRAYIDGFFHQAKMVAAATKEIIEADPVFPSERVSVQAAMAEATYRAIEDAQSVFEGHWSMVPWSKQENTVAHLEKILALCSTDGDMSDIENIARTALAEYGC